MYSPRVLHVHANAAKQRYDTKSTEHTRQRRHAYLSQRKRGFDETRCI